MEGIDNSLYLSKPDAERKPSPDLDKDDFLKILMNQLQNQDPLDPMDDKEFTSQMADFTSLEQMINMGESVEKLTENQTFSPVVQNSHMIGKEVTYPVESDAPEDGEGDEEDGLESSIVTAVSEENGKAVLELENGETPHADAITHITDPTDEHNEGNVPAF